MSGGHGVGRGADGQSALAGLGGPVRQRRVDRLDRDGRCERVIVEIADPRPRPNELPSTVQEQRVAHGRGGGATRQAARAFGDRPGVAEFLGVGQGRHASSHGTLEGLAPRDGLGEDGLPSLPAGLLDRLGATAGSRRGGSAWAPGPNTALANRDHSPTYQESGRLVMAGAPEVRAAAFPEAERPVRLRTTETARRRTLRTASPLVSERPRSASNRRTEATRLAFTAWIPVDSTELRDLSRRVIRRMVHGLPLLRGGLRWGRARV